MDIKYYLLGLVFVLLIIIEYLQKRVNYIINIQKSDILIAIPYNIIILLLGKNNNKGIVFSTKQKIYYNIFIIVLLVFTFHFGYYLESLIVINSIFLTGLLGELFIYLKNKNNNVRINK